MYGCCRAGRWARRTNSKACTGMRCGRRAKTSAASRKRPLPFAPLVVGCRRPERSSGSPTPAGRRLESSRGEYLDHRPPRRSLDHYRQAAVGPAPHPRRRASSVSCATTSRRRAVAQLDVVPVGRRRFLRTLSSGSVSSTRAAEASPRSPARSRPMASRRRTAVESGGRRRCGAVSSVRVSPTSRTGARARPERSLA